MTFNKILESKILGRFQHNTEGQIVWYFRVMKMEEINPEVLPHAHYIGSY